MTGNSSDQAAITTELELLRARHALGQETDDAVEVAQRDRMPLTTAIQSFLPILVRHTGATGAALRTLSEELSEDDFLWPSFGGPIRPNILNAADTKSLSTRGAPESHIQFDQDGHALIAQRLDVVGEDFGCAVLSFPAPLDPAIVTRVAALLDTWCEEVDSYLIAIARARHKHQVTMAIGRALKHPVLEQGITEAIEALSTEVAFDDLVLVYGNNSLHYRIILGGEMKYCSFDEGRAAPPDILAGLSPLLDGNNDILRSLGLSSYREQAIVTGVRDEQTIGRLVVGRSNDFNTFDRDLLERLGDYLRHRLVDFNREWRVLASYFAEPTVLRLMTEEDYRGRYLTPRERDLAVMFCDISGFTRLSEQVLREPALIGEFIDEWSAGVVDILWNSGGVFDKMIGDCVIGLWGPPFFDKSPQALCQAAFSAADRIRTFTRRIADETRSLRALEQPVGVATGLNWCPGMVGFFGPNDDYTCFSSGMNNTARLQGLAACDEILCSAGFVDALGTPDAFGQELSATVKNVAAPLRYRLHTTL